VSVRVLRHPVVRSHAAHVAPVVVTGAATFRRRPPFSAAALKPRIDSGGHLGPQTNLDGEQRIDFQTTHLPTLLIQLREVRRGDRTNAYRSSSSVKRSPDDSLNRSV